MWVQVVIVRYRDTASFFLWKLQNKLGSSCTGERERSQPANGGDQLSQFWPSLPIPNMVQQFQGENFEMIFFVFPGIEWRCMVLCGIDVYK